MLTSADTLRVVARGEWFTTIDLKDAYFHVPVAPHHRQFLRFAYRGRHFQFTVLPFGLSLSPRVFTRVVAAALAPLQTQGMKVLPYLDDWLVCAPPRSQVTQDTARLLSHVARLGLTVNWGKSCLSCGTSGLTVSAATANVDEQPAPRCQWHRQRRVRVTLSCLSLSMEGEGVSGSRCAHGHNSGPPGAGNNRHLPLGMGRSVAGQDCAGTVVCPRGYTAYQRARAQGCAASTGLLSAPFGGQACSGPVGQHVHGFPGEPPGGHQVGTASPGIPEPVDLGVSPSGQPVGSLFTRGQESGCGLPLPTEAPTRRMAASSRGGGLDVGPLRQGGGRPLCLGGVYTLPPLVLLDRSHQPVGAGCVGTRLAGQTAVCLSTIASDPTNTPEGPFAGPPASAGGSLLAREALVSTAAQTLLQCAMAPPRQEGPPVTAEGSDLASRPLSPPALGLATAGPDPLLRDCTVAVRGTVPSARAPSTRLQYENRWKLFSNWCAARAVDPVHCTVATILEFLQFLLDSGRSHSTLKVYVTAISSLHDGVDGATVRRHRLVSASPHSHEGSGMGPAAGAESPVIASL